MRAVSETTSAVDTEFRVNFCLSILYPDRLGRAVFDTVDASGAGFFIKLYRINEFIQKVFLLPFKNERP